MKYRYWAKVNLWVIIVFVSLGSCNKGDYLPADGTKEIVSIDLKMADGTSFSSGDVLVSILGTNIDITVPSNTDLEGLIPYITIVGKSLSPASEIPQNFQLPFDYTVTALDGSTVKYTITVHKNDKEQAIMYVGSSDNNFYALNPLTGALVWKYSSNASFAYSSATYNNGTVYVGGIDNYIYAFDALNGGVKWKKEITTTGIESDAVYVEGTVYVGTNDDYLFALDAATGQVKWSFLTGANVSASPTVSNGVVYFGSSDGNLYALDAATGQLLWVFPTGSMIGASGPTLVDGVVYVGNRDGYLFAIDANTGSQKWKYDTGEISLEQSSATVANGIVFIGGWYNVPEFTSKGSLLAVDANTGNLVWEKLLNIGISSSPTVSEGKVYITADDGKIHALNAVTGETLWEKEILANSASPVVSGGIVYVGGGGTGYIYALDVVTGDEKWKFNTPGGLMTSSPLVVMASGAVHYPGDSGMIP